MEAAREARTTGCHYLGGALGTNYYHRADICKCCGRYDERHICKSMISFQGYRPDPDWPDDETPSLTTWAEWKAAIRAGGEVWDEYGRQWDVEEFIAGVESTKPEARRRQYDWMVENYIRLDHDWLDADGFSFCDQEFS